MADEFVRFWCAVTRLQRIADFFGVSPIYNAAAAHRLASRRIQRAIRCRAPPNPCATSDTEPPQCLTRFRSPRQRARRARHSRHAHRRRAWGAALPAAVSAANALRCKATWALVKATPLVGSRARRRSTSKALSCRRRCGPTLHARHELERLRPDQQRASDGGRYHQIHHRLAHMRVALEPCLGSFASRMGSCHIQNMIDTASCVTSVI